MTAELRPRVMDALVLPSQLLVGERRTYLIELIIVFECRTAYIADFIPDWHIHRLVFNDRCSELMLDRRHVRTMFSHHVLDVLIKKYHLTGYTYRSKIVFGIKILTT